MANEIRTAGTGLRPLGELGDYKVASGNADIRGWDVYGNDDQRIGSVRDLLVDLDALKARYMVVGLKHGFLARERQVVLPVGRARLDDTRDRVYLDDIASTNLDALRDYDAATFREQERTFFQGDYDHADYDEDRFWGARREASADNRYVVLHEEQMNVAKRQVAAGEAVVRKTVETEHVSETVPLVHEQVTVERRPVTGDRAVSGDITVEGEEIRIPVMAEEATVEKRVVPTEEVVVKKTRVTEDRVVEGEVRREHVDVDQSGVKKKEPV